MRFSVWPDPGHSPAEVLDLSRWADREGWYGIWLADHYMPNTGDESFRPGDLHECWALLPAIAEATHRLRLGPLVSPTSVHHPAVLANRAATLDHLSNGRFVLGLGAGWQINEHRAYGIELEPPKQRVDRFEEAIQIVRSLLSEERTTFHGQVYDVTDAPCDPKPLQSRLPILVGTGSPRMLRITARHADEWNTWGSVEMAADRRQKFEAGCEQAGRDPASMHTSVQALFVHTDDEDDAADARKGPMGSRTLAGSSARLVDDIGRLGELGFDEFIVPDWNLGRTQQQRRHALQRLQDEVLAQV